MDQIFTFRNIIEHYYAQNGNGKYINILLNEKAFDSILHPQVQSWKDILIIWHLATSY